MNSLAHLALLKATATHLKQVSSSADKSTCLSQRKRAQAASNYPKEAVVVLLFA